VTAGLDSQHRLSTRPGSRRAGALRGSALADLVVLARRSGAVDLAVGVPGYPEPPASLIDEAVAAVRGGFNQYDDPRGNQRLRQRLAGRLAAPTDPETELTVTVGATEGLCAAVLATIDPADEVVLLEPFYEGFAAAVALAGGIPRVVTLRPPDWRWDPGELAAAFGPRTRALLLNSPANPTGRTFGARELAELAELAARWDVTVISDEVYADLTFDGRPRLSAADVPGLAERSVVIGSLSKNLAISGWRLGYLRADAERTRFLRRVHEVTTQGAAAPFQRAVAQSAALADQSWDPATGLQERRDHLQRTLRAFGLRFHPSEGGCFLLADISAVSDLDSEAYCRWLVEQHGVLVVPGTPFFADPGRGGRYVRVAFNRTFATLDAAAAQLLRPRGVSA
jgi:N-succinyldiaminopimelate aminotransferase